VSRSISAVRDDTGQVVNYIILCSDVTKQKEDETRLQFLAHHDPLTGLPNRTQFQQRCEEALMRAARREAKVAVMFVDLDHFKTVNDSLGHSHGDELLRNVATRLQECTRKTDTVARLGGDEFTILLAEVADSGDVAFIAKKIADRLSASFVIAGHEVYVSASVGISCYPEDGESASVLIKNADAAMYAAKEQGRNNYQFFSAEMNTQALETLMMASSLRLAVERDELILEYQPRLDLATGKVTGAEALVRWNHPNLGRIMPSQFIGLAEKTGLIDPIGEWVLRRACTQMVEWRRTGVALPRVAVNISARQFRHPDFTERIAAILAETGMDPSSLEVEVTESMVMHDPQRTTVILERLKERDVVVAIDDFGTGYSSLSYLKRFPIDYIKIGQSFVRGIPQDAEDVGIVRAIQEAGIHVAGNFIFGLPDDTHETMQQTLDLAVALNCEYANFYSAMAYPGSALYTQAVAKGLSLPEQWSGYSQHSVDCRPLPTDHLTAAEVLQFRDDAFHVYFSSPRYLDMVDRTFGAGTRVHIEDMASRRLKRRLLEELDAAE